MPIDETTPPAPPVVRPERPAFVPKTYAPAAAPEAEHAPDALMPARPKPKTTEDA